VDNSPDSALQRGLEIFGLSAALARPLSDYAALLLKWNERVNLTAITQPIEVIDKHLLDSLAVLGDIPFGPQRVLDLGAGAGLPGVPWALARPDLDVTLVDAVQKKVAFIKAAAASLGVADRVHGLHHRARGAGDTLGAFDVVVSRAFMDIGPWLGLACHYVRPGGVVMAMVGQPPHADVVASAAATAGLTLRVDRRFALPVSGDGRGVFVFEKADQAFTLSARSHMTPNHGANPGDFESEGRGGEDDHGH
jgi:16S rRNA (guanine527-N7)-methyltransferase